MASDLGIEYHQVREKRRRRRKRKISKIEQGRGKKRKGAIQQSERKK
jgi:hypothetical protein